MPKAESFTVIGASLFLTTIFVLGILLSNPFNAGKQASPTISELSTQLERQLQQADMKPKPKKTESKDATDSAQANNQALPANLTSTGMSFDVATILISFITSFYIHRKYLLQKTI